MALQLGEGPRDGTVVRLEEPAVVAHECHQTHALVRGNGHVPPGAPLIEALTMRHQDLAIRRVFTRQESREVVRPYAPGEPDLLGPAAVPARGHDALALPFDVVVAEREFAVVVVARLADRERRRRAQHDANSVVHAAVRLGPRFPLEGGSVSCGSEASRAERLPTVVPGRSSSRVSVLRDGGLGSDYGFTSHWLRDDGTQGQFSRMRD
jgi:hypothetical protein